MGTGYTRNDTSNNIADGNVINASDLDGEFDAIQSAFNGSSGHSHDGTTGEGPQIGTAGIVDANITTAKLADDAVTPAKLQDSGTFQVGQMNAGGDGSSAGTTIKDAKIEVRSGSSAVPAIDLYCEVSNAHKVTIKSPPHASYSGDVTFQLPASNGTNTHLLQTNGSGVLSYTGDIVQIDTSPQLGGNLDVNGNSITSASNGNVVIAPNGTGDVQLDADTVRVGDSNANVTVTTNGTGDLTLNTNAGTNSGSIVIADGANGNITLTPNGTGDVVIDGLNYPQADGSAGQFMKTDGSGQLSFATVDLTAIDIVNDTSPQLGGNLDTNSQNILIDTGHFIADENSNEQIIFTTTGSAVNELTVTNAATGNDPRIAATGGDTNINLNLTGKGTGGVTVTGTMYASGNIGLDSTDYIAWTNNTQMDFYVNGANDMRLESDGDLHVEGDVVAFSTTIASDPRLKENVEQVTDAVAKVEQLTGYTFDYKHGGASAGVMSTDVAQVLPSAVTQTTLPLKTGDEETEYDVVAYDQLHALLIEAVKELSARVKELENGANG